MATIEPYGLVPDEAVRWFREKGYALSFDWRDTWRSQHSGAFTVAKATQLDVLADIRGAVDRAIEEGQTLQQFTKGLRPLLQARGWWGEKEQVDPQTGETKLVQLGSARRLRTIYETNLRQAHAAGHWERFERNAATRPWVRYVTVDDNKVRDEHRKWHGLIRRFDDPIWDTIAPLNGFGDRCKLQQLNDRDLKRFGFEPSPAPQLEYRDVLNKRTGEVSRVPEGVSPGFDYNPGRSRGFTPPVATPELTPTRNFRDYGRTAAGSVTPKQKAPKAWPDVNGDAEAQRTRARFDKLFQLQGKEFATVADPTGVEVIFNKRYLEHLLTKEPSRAAFAPIAKATVESPHEVWMVPFRMRDGSVQMRMRYIGLFQGQDHLVVVERQRDGNVAWTSHPKRNIDAQRQGYLLYAADAGGEP